MSDKPIVVGTRVDVIGKDIVGTVAFVGATAFSAGKWIGVVLDEPKGKNNGTVQGKSYFKCEDNYGIFVRQSQLNILDDNGGPAEKTPSRTSSQESLKRLTTSGIPGRTPSQENLKKESKIPGSKSKIPGSTPAKSSSQESLKKQGKTPASRKTQESKIPAAASGSKESSPSERSSPESDTSKVTKLPTPNRETPPKTTLTEPAASKEPSPASKEPSPARDPNKMAVSQEMLDSLASSVTSINDNLSTLQQQQEADGYKLEIKDLNEKLETLKVKRAEDKNKLKEFEKVKIQLQQLLEYKSKMQEAHGDLNKQLQQAKKEAKDAVDDKERHAEEMADLAEAMEISTLDKEMAEEKSEQLQAEITQLKEKLEEVTLDYEILKQEISEEGAEGVTTTYHMKQLEQQSERLKEALVKMRDLSALDKQESQTLSKENEKLRQQIAGLTKDKEKLTKDVAEAEDQLNELKEQVDAALGAEEMVENLTERNLTLEEKITELEENVADLESLHEMNEELHDNFRENELELREHLDLAQAKVREAERKTDAAQETVADYEQTIVKFRNLVTQLQERIDEMSNQQLENKPDAGAAPLVEKFDIKVKIAETKAHAKAIDMELRKLEVKQANEHIQLLCAFMPDAFMARGNDHDAVLVLLLISRIHHKAELLAEQIKEKFEVPSPLTKEHVIKTHKAELASYASLVIHYLVNLQTIMQQFENALNTCTAELFLKIGGMYPEFALHERTLDAFIQLLKKDQLDETISLEAVEKAIAFFQHVYNTYFVESSVDCTSYLSHHVKLIGSASDCISLDLSRLQMILLPGEETSEISILFKDIVTFNDDIKMFMKKVRRRMPQEGQKQILNFGKEVQDNLRRCGNDMARVVRTINELAHSAMQQLAVLPDADGLPAKKIEELAFQASDKIYTTDDNGPFESLRQDMSTAMAFSNQVATAMQEGEYDSSGSDEKKPTAPVFLRAAVMKSMISDMENLKFKLEAKEDDIRELKKALKVRAEEVSEINIRLGLAEKKIENSSKDADERVEKTRRKLDEANALLKKKEKEYEETMDVLQRDIDALEQDKTELKDKLNKITKRAMMQGISQNFASPTLGGPSTGGAFVPSVPAEVRDSPLLLEQINALKQALNSTKHENARLLGERMKKQMAQLPPLNVPKKPIRPVSQTGFIKSDELSGDSDINNLSRKTNALLSELYKLSASPKVVDITKQKPGIRAATDRTSPSYQLVESTARVVQLQKEAVDLQVQITNLLASQRLGGQVRTVFSQFPSTAYSKVLQEKQSDAKHIGRITIPASGGLSSHATTMKILVQPNQFKHIHSQLGPFVE